MINNEGWCLPIKAWWRVSKIFVREFETENEMAYKGHNVFFRARVMLWQKKSVYVWVYIHT